MYSSFSLPIDPNLLLKRRQYRKYLLNFLKEALFDLQEQFHQFSIGKDEFDKSKNNDGTLTKLILLVGDPASTIKKIIKADKEIEAVFVNRDYTPYSIKRDHFIRKICKNHNIDFIACPDILINEPEELLNSNNQPFKVFSQYYNNAIEIPLRKESSFDITKYKNNIINLDNNKKIKNWDSIERIDNLERFFAQIISKQTPINNSSDLPAIRLSGKKNIKN